MRSAALQLVQHLVLCSGPLMQLGLRMLVLGLSPPPRPPQPGPSPASPGGGAAWKPQPHAVVVQDQVIAVLLKVRAATQWQPSNLQEASGYCVSRVVRRVLVLTHIR